MTEDGIPGTKLSSIDKIKLQKTQELTKQEKKVLIKGKAKVIF